MKSPKIALALGLSILVWATGCAGTGGGTFVHPDYDFGFVERVAVIPFENLTEDRGAGARISRTFVAELLATSAFDVVEPGEVSRALQGIGNLRTAELTQDQIRQLGQELECQALFLGSVVESGTRRGGGASQNVVSLDVRLVETETGSVIWSTSRTEKGRGFWSSLFGTAGRSMSEVSRSCVHKVIGELVS